MFEWKYGKFMPFYAPDNGANGGQGAMNEQAVEGSNNGGAETTPDTTDYKALYLKLKPQFDKTASEVAELKKQTKAKMSEEEQRAAEIAEKEQRYQDLQNEVYEMRVSTAFAKAGFDEKDYGELVKQVVEIGGEKASEFSETLIEFIKKTNKSAVANAKNGAIKDGAVTPKTSTGKTEYTSIAKQVFETNKPNVDTNNIKNRYK